MFLQYHFASRAVLPPASPPMHGGIMAAVAEDLSLPCEHLFLAEQRLDWAVRGPGGGQIAVTSWRSPERDDANQDGALVVWPTPECVVLAVASRPWRLRVASRSSSEGSSRTAVAAGGAGVSTV